MLSKQEHSERAFKYFASHISSLEQLLRTFFSSFKGVKMKLCLAKRKSDFLPGGSSSSKKPDRSDQHPDREEIAPESYNLTGTDQAEAYKSTLRGYGIWTSHVCDHQS